jgi:hypothetical protein
VTLGLPRAVVDCPILVAVVDQLPSKPMSVVGIFAPAVPLAPRALDANRLVAGMADLLRRVLGESIAMETLLASGVLESSPQPFLPYCPK